MLKAIGDRLVVEPYYDADKIGSFFIPDAFKNPEAQQGVVKSAGPLTEMMREGVYVLFPPFRSVPLQGSDLISITEKDVIAYMVDEQLYPLWDHVMVSPDWYSKYQQKSSLIYIPPAVQEDYSPVLFGTIVRAGQGSDAKFFPGEKVVVAPGAGHEIGYKGEVYYFIHERDLLATVDATDN